MINQLDIDPALSRFGAGLDVLSIALASVTAAGVSGESLPTPGVLITAVLRAES